MEFSFCKWTNDFTRYKYCDYIHLVYYYLLVKDPLIKETYISLNFLSFFFSMEDTWSCTVTTPMGNWSSASETLTLWGDKKQFFFTTRRLYFKKLKNLASLTIFLFSIFLWDKLFIQFEIKSLFLIKTVYIHMIVFRL